MAKQHRRRRLLITALLATIIHWRQQQAWQGTTDVLNQFSSTPHIRENQAQQSTRGSDGPTSKLVLAPPQLAAAAAASLQLLPVCSVNPAFPLAVDAARAHAQEVIRFDSRWVAEELLKSIWTGNLFCDLMKTRTTTTGSSSSNNKKNMITLVEFDFSARDLYQNAYGGTGNYLHVAYMWRLAARVFGNIDLVLHMSDALEEADKLILPWVAGYFPESSQPAPPTVPRPNLEQACSNYFYCPILYMLDDIQFEMRRMAIAMMGIPSPDHKAQEFAETYLWGNSNNNNNGRTRTVQHAMQFSGPPMGFKPIYPHARVDDVVLHFRCGDYMTIGIKAFGFMKFWDYERFISPEARSIGIVTQPFTNTGAQQRSMDSAANNRCKKVVMALVDYLQERHPQSRISIYNDANETITLTYARLIMANQTIVGLSTFGLFPVLAAFGTGYIRAPDTDIMAANQFLLTYGLGTFTNSTIVFEAKPRLTSRRIIEMWNEDPTGQSVLEWFRNYDLE